MARTILVTGASAGIGQAICRRLLDDGDGVVGIARDFTKAGLEHKRFTPVQLDLETVDRLAEQLPALVADHADVDGLVCNAGRGRFGELEQFSYGQIRGLMDLNFTSHAFLVRSFLPQLKRGSGDVVFTGSEAALRGTRRGAVYCASKFALRGFAQALREECSRSGVRVGIINPGMVDTAFFDDLEFRPGPDPTNLVLPEDVAAAVAMVLHARPGTVYDEINLSPLKRVIDFDAGKRQS